MVEEVTYLVKMENVAHLFMSTIEYDVRNGSGRLGGGGLTLDVVAITGELE